MIDLDNSNRLRAWINYDRYVEYNSPAIYIRLSMMKFRFQGNKIEIGYQNICSDQPLVDSIKHAVLKS